MGESTPLFLREEINPVKNAEHGPDFWSKAELCKGTRSGSGDLSLPP